MTITAEQLQQVAERLDKPGLRLVGGHRHLYCWNWDEGATSSGGVLSDGDLLLAIMNRAAEIGHLPTLESTRAEKALWSCRIFADEGPFIYGCSYTPLEAAILAFIQLPVTP